MWHFSMIPVPNAHLLVSTSLLHGKMLLLHISFCRYLFILNNVFTFNYIPTIQYIKWMTKIMTFYKINSNQTKNINIVCWCVCWKCFLYVSHESVWCDFLSETVKHWVKRRVSGRRNLEKNGMFERLGKHFNKHPSTPLKKTPQESCSTTLRQQHNLSMIDCYFCLPFPDIRYSNLTIKCWVTDKSLRLNVLWYLTEIIPASAALSKYLFRGKTLSLFLWRLMFQQKWWYTLKHSQSVLLYTVYSATVLYMKCIPLFLKLFVSKHLIELSLF